MVAAWFESGGGGAPARQEASPGLGVHGDLGGVRARADTQGQRRGVRRTGLRAARRRLSDARDLSRWRSRCSWTAASVAARTCQGAGAGRWALALGARAVMIG